MTQLQADHGGQHVNPHHLDEQSPAQYTRPIIQTGAVFGTVFFEVILSADTLPTVPDRNLPDWTLPDWTVPGWTLRLWSQARLGDATLEAAPDQPDQDQDVNGLLRGLQAQGIRALGPLRHRRS